MIKVAMKVTLTTRALFGILFVIAALVGTPIAIFQLQQQQEIRQRADEGDTTLAWATSQTASSVCPQYGSGATVNVTFKNTEPDKTSLSMDVIAKDRQSGKTVNLGSIRGGQSKSGVIETGKVSLNSGTVDFALKWTDGHSGTDSRTATYKSISGCYAAPTPTPTKPYTTPAPTLTPTKPYTTPYPSNYPSPTPTICPTLGPVQNVRIDCPNCTNY